MNSQNIIPVSKKKEDCTCCQCLKETKAIHTIDIPELGYGSAFDGYCTKINLCPECFSKLNKEIWNMEIEEEKDEIGKVYGSFYIHEDEMLKFINSLPLQGRELVENRFDYGFDARPMKPQDWIDYELKELPHKKCKEYGMYSQEEIQAFDERFPKCKRVVEVMYLDGSSGTRCPFGAFGRHRSTECYKCKHFEERKPEESIKQLQSKDWSSYEIFVKSKLTVEKNKKAYKRFTELL